MKFLSSHAGYDSPREKQKYTNNANNQLFKMMSVSQLNELAEQGPSRGVGEVFQMRGISCYDQPGMYTHDTIMCACQLLDVDQESWPTILERYSSISIKSLVELLYELLCLIEYNAHTETVYSSVDVQSIIIYIHEVLDQGYDHDDQFDDISDDFFYIDQQDERLIIDLLEGLQQLVDQGHLAVDRYIDHHRQLIAKLSTNDQREILSYLSEYSDAFDSIAYLQSLIRGERK